MAAMGEDLERLKQRIPLLEYLQRHHWTGHRAGARSEFVGHCPLHEETHPSFYVNPRKNLFYCHDCGRGGDLIRLVELSQHLSFRQSVTYLLEELAPTSQLLEHTSGFYQLELHRHPEGIHYLAQRGLHDPVLIEELGIGYARGGNLRPHLSALGYSLERLLQVGLIGQQGQDAFCRRVIFPCRQDHRIVNLYGRSVGAAFPHRLLPRSKDGLFAWDSVRHFPELILVEGLFDLAVLWQEGFRNTTCAIGTHLTPAHWLSCTTTVIALSTLPLIRTTTRPDNARLKLWLNASIRTACAYASSPCRTVTTRTVTSRPAPHEAISSTASTRLERYDRAPHFASLFASQCLSLSARRCAKPGTGLG